MTAPPSVTPAAALVRWMANADRALDRPGGLTVNQIKALAARPDKRARIAQGVTWFLEEQVRLSRDQDRDKHPDLALVGAYGLKTWRYNREKREEQILANARYHNEAVALALAFCARSDARRAAQSTGDG